MKMFIRNTRTLADLIALSLVVGIVSILNVFVGEPPVLNAQNWRFVTTEYLTGAANPEGVILVGGRRGSLFRIADTTIDGRTERRTEIVDLPGYDDVLALHFVDNTVAVAGLAGGLLFRSVDEGRTWEERTLGSEFSVLGFSTRGDELLAYTRQRIYLSTDGGESWSAGREFPWQVEELRFIDDSTGFAILSTGLLYTTTNGGLEWESAIETPQHPLRSVAFGDGDLGVAVGDSLIVYISKDRGRTWDRASTPERMVDFRTVEIGVDGTITAAGFIPSGGSNGTGLQTSSDTGRTWQNVPLGPSRNFFRVNDILSTPDGLCVVSCNQGRLYGVDGAGVVRDTISESFYFLDQFGGLINNAQPAVNERGEVIVGMSGGDGLRSSDGGVTWRNVSVRPEPIAGFESFRDGEFLAAGSRELEDMMRSSNGGLNWAVHGTESDPALTRVAGRILFSFQSYDSGVALISEDVAGEREAWFYTTDDHGMTYRGEPVDEVSEWMAHHFPEPGIGLAAGVERDDRFDSSNTARYHQIVLRTTDRGESWQTVYRADGNFGYPASVVMLGDREYIAAVDGEVFGGEDRYAIIRTTDGGDNWTKVAGAPLLVTDITQFSDSVLYAVGWSGFLMRSNDRGETWNNVAPDIPRVDTIRQGAVAFPSPINFSHVLLAPDRMTAIIVGNSAILRTRFAEPFPTIADNIGAVPPARKERLRITVYPNPATGRVSVSTGGEGIVRGGRIILYDVAGRSLRTWKQIGSEALVIETSTLADGRYTVVLADDTGIVRASTELIVH